MSFSNAERKESGLAPLSFYLLFGDFLRQSHGEAHG
jgi:hypothetical protein